MGKKNARITVRTTAEMKQELEEIAELVHDRNTNDVARRYLETGIQRDRPRLQKVKAKLADQKTGQSPAK